MHKTSNDLFTGTGLALKQDGSVSRSNFCNERTNILNGVTDTHQASIEVFKVALSCGVSGRHGIVSLFLD